jgi:hypothetical protein
MQTRQNLNHIRRICEPCLRLSDIGSLVIDTMRHIFLRHHDSKPRRKLGVGHLEASGMVDSVVAPMKAMQMMAQMTQ